MSASAKWVTHVFGGAARKSMLCPHRHLDEAACVYFQCIPDRATRAPGCVFAHRVEDLRVPQPCKRGADCPFVDSERGCMFLHPGVARRTVFKPELYKPSKSKATRSRAAQKDNVRWKAPFKKVWSYSTLRGKKPRFPFDRFVNPLPKYPLPQHMQTHLQVGCSLHRHTILSKLQAGTLQLLGEPTSCWDGLCEVSYARTFHELLWIEEVQMLVDIRMYDLLGVRCIRQESLYRVNVPGLAENRPSVLRGDCITAKVHGSDQQVHTGFVHFANLDSIAVSFHPSFNPSYLYDIKFNTTRTPHRSMHRALDNTSDELRRLLCLREAPQCTVSSDMMTQELDPECELVKVLNAPQQQVCKVILSKPSLPTLVFGPPGTGKTRTLVHVVGLLLQNDPTCKVLVTTPSNNAADLICQRLAHALQLSAKEMLRLNGFMRMKNKMLHAEQVLPYCSWSDDEKCFGIPGQRELEGFRVIICTCISSGYLSSIPLARGHFDFIFIDESGEALEPEAMVPLSLAGPNTVVALFGDPKQLGPIVRSPLALEYKLDRSMLERLMQNASCPSVQLVHSYRAHPMLLHIYSSMFYSGTLIAHPDLSASMPIINSCLGWSRLPNPEAPLLFLHVDGQERREADSPSWFNQNEIEAIKPLVDHLLADGHLPIDIGIISPYQKQNHKLKSWIHSQKPKLDGIKVGSVEQFQGDERKIILLSTVRSRNEEMVLGEDLRFRLGFLHNPKRLNVAISRAQALLVIVGNALLLHDMDPHWASFLKHCIALRAYEGPCPPTISEAKHTPSERTYGEWCLIDDHGTNDDAAWRDDY